MSSEGVTAEGLPSVRIATGSGSITVIGEDRDGVATDGKAIVKIDGDSINVVGHKGSHSLTVRCPEGSDVVVGTRSGSLKLRGKLGELRAQTMTGWIDVEDVASADLRTMSSSIHVAKCEGAVRAKTKSGSLHVESAGSVDLAVGSGSIDVDHVDGAVRARAISGTISVAAEGKDSVEAETMSGSITITVPAGCHPRVRAKSLSRSTDIGVPAGDDCEILAKTMSGGIRVQPR